MSDSTTGKMNCLGCNKNKPTSEFASPNSPLCKRCKSAKVSTSKSDNSIDGSWIGDIGGAIGDFIGGMLD